MKYTLAIKKNRDFRYIFKKGNFIKGKYINVYSNNNNNRNINFLGICVSKKNGNSVSRNKLKRWGREAYKNLEKNIKKGKRIVILYKKSTIVSGINYNLLESDLVYCLKELNLYE